MPRRAYDLMVSMSSNFPGLQSVTELSVILYVPNRRETVLRTLEHLQAQTVRERMEVVLIGPSLEALEELRPDLQAFGRSQLIPWKRTRNLAAARAGGLRAARSPLVVHAEDHCFPEAGWAEALINAFAPSPTGSIPTAVGPLMVNENPATLWSWAAFTLHFGHCAFAHTRGETRYVATHNTCFRRDVLVALGDALDSGIEMELLLQDRLRREGHTILHETRAVAHHTNVSLPMASLTASFYGGWLFSTVRMREEQWGLGRKLFQLAASPLVPVLQLKRRWSTLGTIAGEKRLLPMVALPVLLIATLHTVGEVVGILFPRDSVVEDYSNFENTRERFVRNEEKPLLAGRGAEIPHLAQPTV